jgi:hypothetical protein
LLASSPLEEVDALEDSLPVEVELVEASAPEDGELELLDDSAPVDALLGVDAEDACAAAAFLAAALASAGSCPEASCTKITRKAALNTVAARLAIDRRMRLARRVMASRLALASALASSCSGLMVEGGVWLGVMVAPIELSIACG